MATRDLAGFALIAGALWGLWRSSAGRVVAATGSKAPTAPSGGPGGLFPILTLPPTFTASTARRESGGALYAKNPNSTASGKYQFTRDTWVRLGGAWGSDPSKAFGGLQPSESEQDARFARLSAGNAAGLQKAGQAVTNATLYAAHFLGLAGALKVLTAAPSTSLASVVGSAVMAANPQLRGFNVADFRAWLNRRG